MGWLTRGGYGFILDLLGEKGEGTHLGDDKKASADKARNVPSYADLHNGIFKVLASEDFHKYRM